MDHGYDKFVPVVLVVPVAFVKGNFFSDRIFVVCAARLLGLLLDF